MRRPAQRLPTAERHTAVVGRRAAESASALAPCQMLEQVWDLNDVLMLWTAGSIMPGRSSCGRAVDMEHRAVGVCPGLDEVEHEGRGESREQREPVSQRHWLKHEPVFVD